MSAKADHLAGQTKPSGKKKGTTLPLTDFLKPSGGSKTWADDTDNLDDLPALPTAPGEGPAAHPHSSGAPLQDLPDSPPFKVFVGNIPYDVQEQDIADVFTELAINDIHILRHHDTKKPKGVFVEFASQQDLATALRLRPMLMGRALRVDLAQRQEGSGRSSDFGASRGGSGSFGSRGFGGGGGGFADRDRDRYDGRASASGRREYGSGGYGEARGFGEGGFAYGGPGGGEHLDGRGGGRPRDRGGFAGSYEPAAEFGAGREHSGGGQRGSFERTRSGDKGGLYDRHSGGDRDRGPGGRFEAEGPDRWASQHQPSAEPAAPSSGERPKLNLAPRGSGGADASAGGEGSLSRKKSNPFGDAKPVDTGSKLKELEERMAREQAEEKARKRAEREAADAEKEANRRASLEQARAGQQHASAAKSPDGAPLSPRGGEPAEGNHHTTPPGPGPSMRPGSGGRGGADPDATSSAPGLAHHGSGGRGGRHSGGRGEGRGRSSWAGGATGGSGRSGGRGGRGGRHARDHDEAGAGGPALPAGSGAELPSAPHGSSGTEPNGQQLDEDGFQSVSKGSSRQGRGRGHGRASVAPPSPAAVPKAEPVVAKDDDAEEGAAEGAPEPTALSKEANPYDLLEDDNA